MSAVESRRWRLLVLLAFGGVVVGCEGKGPSPALRDEVTQLRAILRDDPASAPIEEVEKIARERPVHAAEALEREALPLARRQLERVRELRAETDEGKAYVERIAAAYAERVSGLERWRLYLADGAIDDFALLESTRMLREATVALVTIDREMDSVLPIERPRPD